MEQGIFALPSFAPQEQEVKVPDAGRLEWSDLCWNPVVGCSKVSSGCKNCTAEGQAGRFSKSPIYKGLVRKTPFGPVWTNEVRMVEGRVSDPLTLPGKRLIWVNSMSDLFHQKVTDEFLVRVYGVMARSNHTFQVLTKRIDRAVELLSNFDFIHSVEKEAGSSLMWPLPNVWLGTSVEDQEAADGRVPPLLKSTAAFKFLSCQPLLQKVNLEKWLKTGLIGWAVIGAETGPKARPANINALFHLTKQFSSTGVPYLMKWTSL